MSFGERRTFATCSADNPADWIVAIASTRNPSAFVALFETFAPKIKGYHLLRGASDSTAEELAQETLLAVWRNADQFEPNATTAAAWIYTILRNLSIDRYRHDGLREDGRIEVADDAANPGQIPRSARDVTRLRDALNALPIEEAKIAASLGVPLGTVKSRIRLASHRLRASLGATSDSYGRRDPPTDTSSAW